MSISASRRTDIPSFYSEWFFRRLEAGYHRSRLSPALRRHYAGGYRRERKMGSREADQMELFSN